MSKIKNLPTILKTPSFKKKLTEICKENSLIFMAIFGSFVRNKQTKRSDIDILIKFEENSGKTLFDLVAISEELQNVFKRKVDLVEMEALTNKYVKEDVLNSMQVIYENR